MLLQICAAICAMCRIPGEVGLALGALPSLDLLVEPLFDTHLLYRFEVFRRHFQVPQQRLTAFPALAQFAGKFTAARAVLHFL